MTVPTFATALLLVGTPPEDLGTELGRAAPMTPPTIEMPIEPPPPSDQPETYPILPPILLVFPSEPAANNAAVTVQQDGADAGNEIVVTGDTHMIRADPLQEVNLASYEAVQAVDQALVAPIAKTYQRAIPEPVRDGLGNALRNVSEPVNFLNFLLQLKIGKAFETAGRFAINTTLGIGGLFDVAKKKPFHLPYRRNGLANTLGFYGVKPGPYFYLPLIGPTTLRDMAGNSIDLLLVPTVVGKPFDRTAYAVPANVVMQLNARIDRDAEIQRLQQESPNPYAETRSLYLQMRQLEIDALKSKRQALPTIGTLPLPSHQP
jgi:phospholipid-binding lipoprotein MlaA